MWKPCLLLAPVLVTVLSVGDAGAAEAPIALGELSPAYGIDYGTLESAAVAEIGAIDARQVKRRVVVSLAVVKGADAPVAVAISALVRDKKTGAMLAVLSGKAQSDANGKGVRDSVLRAAVRSALSQVPQAAR